LLNFWGPPKEKTRKKRKTAASLVIGYLSKHLEILRVSTGLPVTFSVKEVTLETKMSKSDYQFTKSDFYPIEKAAIVSFSNANRQE